MQLMAAWRPAAGHSCVLGLLLATGAGARAIAWDPDELPADWWHLVPPSAPQPACGPRGWGNDSRFVEVVGPAYSLDFNALQTLKSALMLALGDTPRRALLLAPSPKGRSSRTQVHAILDAFDVLAATRSWACVVIARTPQEAQALRHGADVRVLTAKDAFHMPVTLLAGAGAVSPATLFHEAFMAQLLLRPRPRVRAAVERLEAELGVDGVDEYAVAHLRGQSCYARCGSGPALARTLLPLRLPTGRAVGAHDVCDLQPLYLEAALGALAVPARAPVFIVHHDADVPRESFAALQSWRDNVTFPQRHARFAELLREAGGHETYVLSALAVRAPAFVGNPTSTFSSNVAKARAHLLFEPRINMRRDAVTIHIANTEDPGAKHLTGLTEADASRTMLSMMDSRASEGPLATAHRSLPPGGGQAPGG